MSLMNAKTTGGPSVPWERGWLRERAEGLRAAWGELCGQMAALPCVARGFLSQGARDEEGQGTTEYALVVGVLVVIAIAALTSIREKVQTLWDSITGAMGTL